MIIAFVITVTLLLTFDIYQHRVPGMVTLRAATCWSLFYVFCALCFSVGLVFFRNSESAVLFLTGWSLEKVLAMDNLIVFAAIFGYFGIEDKHQHKILHWGILGAIIFRLIFVAIGTGSLSLVGPAMEVVFALVIAYTAYLMIKKKDEDAPDYRNAWYIRLLGNRINTDNKADKFVVSIDGRLYATPLLLALITVEVSDIVFSFDSVPAVIAVTRDPFLVYSAMIFAILGLRSLYFVLSALMRYLVHLEKSVIVVLFWISAKLLAGVLFNFHFIPLVALFITMSILLVGILSSLLDRRGKSCSLQ